MKNSNNFYLIGIVLILLQSCIGANTMKGQRGGKNLYEMYLIDSVTNQYFIKPLTFKNEQYSMDFDVVFRLPATKNATVNFSFFSNTNIYKIDNFFIGNEKNTIRKIVYTKKLFYKEKKGSKYHYRYSSEIDLATLNMLYDKKIKFIFNFENKEAILLPTKKTIKKSKNIKENVIDFR